MSTNPYALNDQAAAPVCSNGRSRLGSVLFALFIACGALLFFGCAVVFALLIDPNLDYSIVTLVLSIALWSGLIHMLTKKTLFLQHARVWIARDALSYAERGLVLLSRNRFDEAMSDLNSAVSRDPAFANGYTSRSAAWLNLSEWDKAIEDSTAALELDPALANAYNGRSVAWLEKCAYQNALSDCNEAIRIDPKLKAAYVNRSCVFLILEKGEQALRDTRQAIKLGERGLSLQDLHCKALMSNGLLDEAHDQATKTLDTFGPHKEIYLLRGQIAGLKAQYESALSDYRKAIELDDSYVDAWNGLGGALLGSQRYDEAIDAVTRVIELGSEDANVYSNRALANHFTGRLEAAMADHDRALQADDASALVRNNRGFTLHALGRYHDAADEYERAIVLDGSFPNSYKNLAWQLATCPVDSLRDGKRAVELATKAHELTQWRQEGWVSILAAAYAESGDFATAVEWQQKAEATDATGETSSALELYRQGKPFREE